MEGNRRVPFAALAPASNRSDKESVALNAFRGCEPYQASQVRWSRILGLSPAGQRRSRWGREGPETALRKVRARESTGRVVDDSIAWIVSNQLTCLKNHILAQSTKLLV